MTRVIIDAGHGGTARAGNSSAFGSRGPSGTLEKDITLDIACHVVQRLGHGASLTRSGDTNLTLGARAREVVRRGADVFVSIHANSGPPDASGPEVYVHPDAGGDSHRLADGVQRALERLRGRYGGISEPRNGVMAVLDPRSVGPATSACLVEVDYLSNPRSEQRLRDPSQRAAIGAAIASAIQEHSATRKDSATPEHSATRKKQPYAQAAAAIEPQIDYSVTSLEDANRIWIDWLARYAEWLKGVPDSAIMYFPHSAICQLRLFDDNRNRSYVGTGFYIGDDKILSCGHNFYDIECVDSAGNDVSCGDPDAHEIEYRCTRVRVEPGFSPTLSTFATREFNVRGADLVHPQWLSSRASDGNHDLSVLRVPGFTAPNGNYFTLASRSLGPNEGIVVSGYGLQSGESPSNRRQRMYGSHIGQADTEMVYYPIQTLGGHSGSPVFSGSIVIGVHTGPRMMPGGGSSRQENRGVLLNPDKIDWINRR